MSQAGLDQADGLRQLLMPATPTRVVAVAGMSHGVGTTTTAINLSAALMAQGRLVLLVDEHGGSGGDGAAAQAGCAVKVLPAADSAGGGNFDARSLCPAGVIVIDAAFDSAGRLSALAQRADELVIVMQSFASSITSTYAGLKRLHGAHPIQRFRLLVNGATSAQQAQRIMANIADAGSRYLAVSLQPAGWVRSDPLVRAARRLRQAVAQAYPASPAAEDFRRLAVEVGNWTGPQAAASGSQSFAANRTAGALFAPGAACGPGATVA